jgi:hypothetical protein
LKLTKPSIMELRSLTPVFGGHERGREKMTGRTLAIWGTMLAVAWAAVVMGEAMLVSPAWSSPGVASAHMLLLAAATLLTLVGVIIGVLSITSATARALPVLGVCIAATVSGFYTGDAVRMAGFRKCGERLRPTVTAIRDYESQHGYPPAHLADAGLPAQVESGLGAYPVVMYKIAPPDRPIHGNRWMLTLETFSGSSWDQFILLPNGHYPEAGFGGAIQRLGEWAYVHE